MNRFYLSAGLVVLISTAAALAGEKVDNPKYQVWAKFKPGSSSTVEADVDQAGKRYHIKTTRTLISIAEDKLVVETKSSATVEGKAHDEPPWQEAIPSKIDQDANKQIGDKEIDAMGKTFKCKVFDAKGDSVAKPSRKTPAGFDAMRGTVYISDEVPGGLVRLDSVAKDGKNVTFVLTGMEAK